MVRSIPSSPRTPPGVFGEPPSPKDPTESTRNADSGPTELSETVSLAALERRSSLPDTSSSKRKRTPPPGSPGAGARLGEASSSRAQEPADLQPVAKRPRTVPQGAGEGGESSSGAAVAPVPPTAWAREVADISESLHEAMYGASPETMQLRYAVAEAQPPQDWDAELAQMLDGASTAVWGPAIEMPPPRRPSPGTSQAATAPAAAARPIPTSGTRVDEVQNMDSAQQVDLPKR